MEIPNEFKLLSSEVDWCEENYTVTPFIAEFWNTVSNAIFLIIPPILSIKYKNYGEVLKVPVGYVWSLLTIVGLGSIYFHSTLSLVGQLVDEIAILWVIMCAWALFLPTSMLPYPMKRQSFYYLMTILTVLFTIICFKNPELNHNALHFFAIPCVAIVIYASSITKSETIKKLNKISIFWFVLGFSSWLIDRNFCEYVSAFPYLHCFWHLFICIGAYLSIVSQSYFYAEIEHPETTPEIKFFPFENEESWRFVGVPYVKIHLSSKSKTI
ncbi:unnamed protein product [Oikopleura dioica]|uniref:Alkaline ceramidase n=2 Tax=Oikopleura dioica TaxID=34765 RepID=E4XPG1_OIKDI|nr:unnamed protein product [Oikopleura dioica]CBY32139.1 unnamed protein product [Oikopleura dioica]